MQRNFGWSKNFLTTDTVISTDNIVEIGEKLAIGSLKRLVSYRGDIALNLYRALIKDLYSRQNPNYVVSNAYDYVQIACLYLCGHIGQKLGDIVTDRRNAKVTKRLKELESKQQDLEEKIAMEKAKSILITTKDEIRNFYEKALLLEPKMLIEYLVDRIELFNDEAIIYYKSPLRTSPDDSQGFSFYNKKVKMQVYMGNKLKFEHIDMLVEMVV